MSQTDKLLGFFTTQALPKVTVTKFSLVDLPEVTSLSGDGGARAYDLYAKHYTTLRKKQSSLSPKSVMELTDGVNHAQLAIVLWNLSSDKEGSTMADDAANLQVLIFRAGNWLRRFLYDRTDLDHWFDSQEMAECALLAKEMTSKGEELTDVLLKVDPSLEDKVEQNRQKWAEAQARASDTDAIQHHEKKLSYALDTVTTNIRALRFFVREMCDHRPELTESQARLVDRAREILEATQLQLETPAWRTDGIQHLGPFGVEEILGEKRKPKVFLQTNFKTLYSGLNSKALRDKLQHKVKGCGEYSLLPDSDMVRKYAKYAREDGRIGGATSPFAYISIPKSDPTFKLIRIPANGVYFAWAYPVIDKKIELDLDDVGSATAVDLFLLLGGFIYFDHKMELIQCNALVPQGSQLQFSSPNQLPEDIFAELEARDRFREITLDGLKDATHFAWILPGEFSCEPGKTSEWSAPLPFHHPGAFAYKYGDDMAKNNYFVLAAVDSALGKKEVETTVILKS